MRTIRATIIFGMPPVSVSLNSGIDNVASLAYALKFVEVIVMVPSAAMVAAVEVPTAERAALPQGLAEEGLWTSLRAGVPETPSIGTKAL